MLKNTKLFFFITLSLTQYYNLSYVDYFTFKYPLKKEFNDMKYILTEEHFQFLKEDQLEIQGGQSQGTERGVDQNSLLWISKKHDQRWSWHMLTFQSLSILLALKSRISLGKRSSKYFMPTRSDITKNEADEKYVLTLQGKDLNISLTCALIHQACSFKNKDIRQFLDGIFQ
ncbi:unnamed protein product [Paramecium octaurelia]|uniref:Uncharacterized protein n=1 Tax=Paramecium octaurelia TaxID=43137 RepID=A0A8S1Y301_PAROT|nr:unnamed protein product [Paramecium octaurelia]